MMRVRVFSKRHEQAIHDRRLALSIPRRFAAACVVGSFLRECSRGRSTDCLPHGYHPCKAINSAFLYDIDNSVELESALMLRFLDDFYLFDDDERVLIADSSSVFRA
jgi:hypothetical protein